MSLTELSSLSIKDRVVEVRRMRLGDIRSHPLNPKYHPDEQKELVGELLTNIGWLGGGIMAYHSARLGGELTLLNGHLRKSLVPDLVVNVEITDLDDAEADLAVALLDESAGKAEIAPETFNQLLKGIDTGNVSFMAALGEMTARAKMYQEEQKQGSESKRDGSPQNIPEQWLVLIECVSEHEQAETLESLTEQGYKCKALIS